MARVLSDINQQTRLMNTSKPSMLICQFLIKLFLQPTGAVRKQNQPLYCWFRSYG